ncbi:MAG: hypothetical protein K6B52_01760 [Clostridiales bacterium]|nr:hypothetical protein [Clostridiales bacterium]
MKNKFTVSITKGTGIQTVSGEGTYSPGDTVTVYADMYYGYVFDRWTKSSSTVSTSAAYTFTMPSGNLSLTAKAKLDKDN